MKKIHGNIPENLTDSDGVLEQPPTLQRFDMPLDFSNSEIEIRIRAVTPAN